MEHVWRRSVARLKFSMESSNISGWDGNGRTNWAVSKDLRRHTSLAFRFLCIAFKNSCTLNGFRSRCNQQLRSMGACSLPGDDPDISKGLVDWLVVPQHLFSASMATEFRWFLKLREAKSVLLLLLFKDDWHHRLFFMTGPWQTTTDSVSWSTSGSLQRHRIGCKKSIDRLQEVEGADASL